MSKQELKQKGFTIIEVVLVLAIAALIFLMVFIALPALQRNQRDTARKQELGKVVSAVTTWQSNHRGASPAAGDMEAFAKYVDGAFVAGVGGAAGRINLTTTSVTIVASQTTGHSVATNDMIALAPGTGCNTDGAQFATPTSTRKAAAVVQLENGDAFVCQDS